MRFTILKASVQYSAFNNKMWPCAHLPYADLCRKPQQISTGARHPAEKPEQAAGVPQPLPDGPGRRRAVLQREELPDQADKGAEEASVTGRRVEGAGRPAHRWRHMEDRTEQLGGGGD